MHVQVKKMSEIQENEHTPVESEESIARRQESMQGMETLWLLKYRADVTSTKQGYQWAHMKDLCIVPERVW